MLPLDGVTEVISEMMKNVFEEIKRTKNSLSFAF